MPEWKDIINYIFTFLNIIVTGVLTYLVFSAAKTNNKLVRAFSSEKPFLQLVSYDCSIEKFTLPRIQIKNVGPGHAVNIEVFTSLLKSDNKYTIVKLKGTNIIPYNQNEQNNVESYEYEGKESLFMPEDDKKNIWIYFENSSGYEDKIHWKVENDKFIVITETKLQKKLREKEDS